MYQVFVFSVARPVYNLGQLDYARHCSAILEGYELCSFSAYPFIVPGRGRVVGDLVEVDEEGLKFIEEWEGWRGEKQEVSVLVGKEERDAITYVSPISEARLAHRIPSGDWLDSW